MASGSASAGSVPTRGTGVALRAPLLALGFIALVLAIDGGLVRLGYALPAPAAGIAWHGALVASASGTFKYLSALPTGGRKLQRLNASD